MTKIRFAGRSHNDIHEVYQIGDAGSAVSISVGFGILETGCRLRIRDETGATYRLDCWRHQHTLAPYLDSLCQLIYGGRRLGIASACSFAANKTARGNDLTAFPQLGSAIYASQAVCKWSFKVSRYSKSLHLLKYSAAYRNYPRRHSKHSLYPAKTGSSTCSGNRSPSHSRSSLKTSPKTRL